MVVREQELTERVRTGYEAWNEGDLEQTIELLDPEVEWLTSSSFPGVKAAYHGHQGFREFSEDLREPWEEVRVEIEGLERDEELALIRLRFRGRSVDSGVEVDLPWFQALRIVDEKVTHSALNRSVGDALEALGAGHRWPEF